MAHSGFIGADQKILLVQGDRAIEARTIGDFTVGPGRSSMLEIYLEDGYEIEGLTGIKTLVVNVNHWKIYILGTEEGDLKLQEVSSVNVPLKSDFKELFAAFKIFAKYRGSQTIAAEHDEIYSGPSPSIVSDSDLKKLRDLGWNDYGRDCFERFV